MKRKSKPLRYFYLNGDIHKKIHISRPNDVITAWNYPQHKRVVYTYSDVKKRMQTAYSTQQVCDMLGRERHAIERAIADGMIEAPQQTYNVETGNIVARKWREEDIIAIADYFRSVHRGRPRLDGLITPQKLPTDRELKAMIRNQTVLYVQVDDGEFRPTWQAQF